MLTINLLANFFGKGWAAIIWLVYLPLCVKFLGIETYGLLGFLLSVQSMIALLDFGFSQTAAREFARRSGTPEEKDSASLLRTFETVYWGEAVLIAACIMALAPFAGMWFAHRTLSSHEITIAFFLFSAFLAAAWPASLYSGGLSGLEKQVALNVVSALTVTVRNIGGLMVLWTISPTIEGLLIWQSVINLGSTLLLRGMLKSYLPKGDDRPRFRIDLIRQTARYAAGVTGILALLTLLSQMDKVILARLLPLETFGYYMFASNVALALVFLTGPVMAAIFPRLVKAYGSGDFAQLSNLYHGSSQLISLLVVPTGAVLALFSHELLQIWTGNPAVGANSGPLLSVLAVAMTLNLLVNPSYTLQAGAGYNRIVFYIHLLSVFAMSGALLLVTPIWGAIGAGICWVGLYLFHLTAGPTLMHRRLLVGELGRWWRNDVLIPGFSGLMVVIVGRMLIPSEPILPILLMWIGLVWIIATVVQLLLSTELRPLAERQMILGYRGALSNR